MLKWREDYYVGEGIKDAAKARRRIDAGRVAFGVYLVTLSENPGNLLEIVPSYMLIQKSYYARCPEIVGMAKGKDEAIDLVLGNNQKINIYMNNYTHLSKLFSILNNFIFSLIIQH